MRFAVASNPSAPPEILGELLKDPDEEVRVMAFENIKKRQTKGGEMTTGGKMDTKTPGGEVSVALVQKICTWAYKNYEIKISESMVSGEASVFLRFVLQYPETETAKRFWRWASKTPSDEIWKELRNFGRKPGYPDEWQDWVASEDSEEWLEFTKEAK